jgi:hypothetical protein
MAFMCENDSFRICPALFYTSSVEQGAILPRFTFLINLGQRKLCKLCVPPDRQDRNDGLKVLWKNGTSGWLNKLKIRSLHKMITYFFLGKSRNFWIILQTGEGGNFSEASKASSVIKKLRWQRLEERALTLLALTGEELFFLHVRCRLLRCALWGWRVDSLDHREAAGIPPPTLLLVRPPSTFVWHRLLLRCLQIAP